MGVGDEVSEGDGLGGIEVGISNVGRLREALQVFGQRVMG